jgi:hypothetical protein
VPRNKKDMDARDKRGHDAEDDLPKIIFAATRRPSKLEQLGCGTAQHHSTGRAA